MPLNLLFIYARFLFEGENWIEKNFFLFMFQVEKQKLSNEIAVCTSGRRRLEREFAMISPTRLNENIHSVLSEAMKLDFMLGFWFVLLSWDKCKSDEDRYLCRFSSYHPKSITIVLCLLILTRSTARQECTTVESSIQFTIKTFLLSLSSFFSASSLSCSCIQIYCIISTTFTCSLHDPFCAIYSQSI